MEGLNCKRCNYIHQQNGNCTAVGGFCTAVPAAYCKKLAEYMDTELEPEDIKKALNEEAVLKLAAQALGTTPERLREMVKAGSEGRVHIAPIRDGTAIFYHIDDDENMFPEVKDGIFEGIYVNGHIEHLFGEMGVGWFLTRAEAKAKAALGGGRDGGGENYEV